MSKTIPLNMSRVQIPLPVSADLNTKKKISFLFLFVVPGM